MSSDPGKLEPAPDSASLDEQLVAYLDGELDDATARHIETLVADDPELRARLRELGQAWELLDQLDRPRIEETFTETTLELVAVQAEAEAEDDKTREPRRRRRRQAWVGGTFLAAGLAGFLAVAALWPNPNRSLLEDLPVVENVDEYLQVLGDDESVDQSIDFLRRLHQEQLFVDEDRQGEDDHAP
ncbi:MAG: hypothetical protein JW719_08615 [Pirellulales bacterium]|nr:hypothetical protein [Pirellulales bacterium]